MRLLSLTLNGTYKGLKDQTFDFQNTKGNIVAFIGLNGSGKSQLLELVGEIFSWIERISRSEFKCSGSVIEYGFSISWELNTHVYSISQIDFESIAIDSTDKGFMNSLAKDLAKNDESTSKTVICYFNQRGHSDILSNIADITPDHIVGYSSGLNENLQRSFMKNSLQYFKVMRTKANFLRLQLKKAELELDSDDFKATDKWYKSRHKEIFDIEHVSPGTDIAYTSYDLKNISLPKCIYLDYDCSSLIAASLSVLSSESIDEFLSEITYKYPTYFVMKYDFKNEILDDDDIDNIQRFIKNSSEFEPLSERVKEADDENFNGIEYLSGNVKFDLKRQETAVALADMNYQSQLQFFERLYGLQLLGVDAWPERDKDNLGRDNFIGNVKKPLKTSLPVEITTLKLSNADGDEVDFDDLSDGEIQLIQTLTAARMFREKNTLFLFDEPETHLNPSWRTNFHNHLNNALQGPEPIEQQSQLILSTHSPFMISSLKKEDVFFFKRNEENQIEMRPVNSQTYGASFDVLIKEFFNLKSLISQSAIEDIRDQLAISDEHAKQWIEANLGMSSEKAYMIRKLSQ